MSAATQAALFAALPTPRARLGERDITGSLYGYVQCTCGSKNVRVFDLYERPTYEQGRRVSKGGRVVGRICDCRDCKATSRTIFEEAA